MIKYINMQFRRLFTLCSFYVHFCIICLIMTTFIYSYTECRSAERHYVECHRTECYDKCRYTECQYAEYRVVWQV
jgi:hypothetical protein